MNEYGKKFDLVKEHYNYGLWPIEWVRDAVVKEWITPLGYKEITGEDYK